MANTKKNIYKLVYNQLAIYGRASASQLSSKLKKLTPHQIAGVLSVLYKHGVVDRDYNDKYACIIWKTKNLNSSYINSVLENVGGEKMTEKKEVPMVLYKGEFITVAEYEARTKPVKKPVGKLAQERWFPLLKHLSELETPTPLREIVAAVGPNIANSIWSLRAKGYIILVHRKYSITPKGKEYLQELQSKLEEVSKVSVVTPKEEAMPVAAKQVAPVKTPAPAKKPAPEPEEIFE